MGNCCVKEKKQVIELPRSRVTKAAPKKSILICNQSKREVLVYVVADPNALRLKKKVVIGEGSAHAKAGAHGVGVDLGAKKSLTEEYEAEGGGFDVQKKRIKPLMESLIHVNETSFIAVLFIKDGLYYFAKESEKLPVRDKFTIRDDHFVSDFPFKTSTEEPNYGSMMEFGSGSFGQRSGSVEQ